MTHREITPYDRYDALIARHGMTVRRMCWRRSLGDDATCDELMQECYIALWLRLPTLRVGEPALQEKAWVVWTCRSVFSHRLRRKQSTQPLGAEVDESLAVSTDDESREWIEELAGCLNRRERLALSLMIEGYSHKEIAAALGMRRDSVAKLRRRIVEKMRKRYDQIQNHKYD